MRGLLRICSLSALLVLTAGGGAGGALLVGALARCEGSLACAVWLGSPLLEVQAPGTGVVRGSVPILVRFPQRERVSPATFQCLLDGVDVTDLLARGEDGARGLIHPARPGPMRLRVSVFGEGSALGAGRFVEHRLELDLFVASEPVLLDRASPSRAPGAA